MERGVPVIIPSGHVTVIEAKDASTDFARDAFDRVSNELWAVPGGENGVCEPARAMSKQVFMRFLVEKFSKGGRRS